MLVSDQRLQLHSGGSINFGQMTLHLLPGAVMVGIAVFFLVRFMFSKNTTGSVTQARVHELGIWRRAAGRIAGSSPEECSVREQLLRHVQQLEQQLKEEASRPHVLPDVDVAKLEEKVVVVVVVVVFFFF